MDYYSNYLTPLSKSLLTGLFAGIASTFICIIYNIVYRGQTSYGLFAFINVSSLIFLVNLLFVAIGLIYYCFIRFAKRGDLIFAIVFILLSVLFIVKIPAIHRVNDAALNSEFHHLMIAMVVIMGIAAAIGIPVLYNSKRFEEEVL
jgi:hypothetical protein